MFMGEFRGVPFLILAMAFTRAVNCRDIGRLPLRRLLAEPNGKLRGVGDIGKSGNIPRLPVFFRLERRLVPILEEPGARVRFASRLCDFPDFPSSSFWYSADRISSWRRVPHAFVG